MAKGRRHHRDVNNRYRCRNRKLGAHDHEFTSFDLCLYILVRKRCDSTDVPGFALNWQQTLFDYNIYYTIENVETLVRRKTPKTKHYLSS